MLRHCGGCTIVGGPFSADMASENRRNGVSWIFDEERVGLRSYFRGGTLP